MVTSISILDDSNLGFQIHAYKSGHQLLFSTKDLTNEDQDTIDRLSDISGSLRPGETFDPYFTCYPLPSNSCYVVARTWQDVSAPRSGCVITKSLIIDQDLWGSAMNVFIFFEALTNMSSDIDLNISTVEFSDNLVPAVDSQQLDALTNAIFISKREPAVVFDYRNSLYALIRILTVQWPSLRNRFAACTFALSQRTIDGRPFDLLFAPATSKSKFSNWTGKFIEPGILIKEEKVTRLVSESIFDNVTPSLLRPELRNFFAAEVEINDETFRLSLLWIDLSNKLNTDQPYYAILGLLDIANILPQHATVALYNSIRSDIVKSVQIAPDKLSAAEALKFFTSLLLRHKRKLMDRELFYLVGRAVTKVSQKDTLDAISFLQSYQNPTRRIPSSIYSGVASGMAISVRDENKSAYIQKVINPEIGLLLTSTSQEFAEIAVDYYEKNQSDWRQFLKMIFANDIGLSKSRAAKKITLSITENSPKALLEILLNDSDEKTYKNVVNKSTLAKKINNTKFVEPILDSALRLDLTDYLLNIIFTNGNQEFVSIVLINLLLQIPTLFEKILLDERLNLQIAARIIDRIFIDPNEQFLNLIKKSEKHSNFLLTSPVSEHLLHNTTASILTYAYIPLGSALLHLNQLPSEAINSVNNHNLTSLLARAMKELDNQFDSNLQSLLTKIKKVHVNYLYEAAIHHNNASRRTLGNIEILFGDLRFQTKLIENIDYISRILDAHLPAITSQTILSNWARILKQANKYKDIQKQAAVFMLNYAYKKTQKDPTELIEVAFPIIYRSFLKGKTIAAAFSSIFFPDWDKCKTLREQLVEMYFIKTWSKFGLLTVAHSADILKEVVKTIAHQKDAKQLFEKALQEGKNSPKRPYILKAIAKLKL